MVHETVLFSSNVEGVVMKLGKLEKQNDAHFFIWIISKIFWSDFYHW